MFGLIFIFIISVIIIIALALILGCNKNQIASVENIKLQYKDRYRFIGQWSATFKNA